MPESNTYHHGNLRDSLICAAREVIERDGHAAVSLRELAQALEVSRGAPYRHFADRDALLMAVAASGFRELLQAHAAVVQSHADRRTRAQESGRAFLAFTEAHPRLFMLMFDSGVLPRSSENDELGAQLQATYRAVGETVRQAWPQADEARVKLGLISMWSTLYGFARLRLDSSLKTYMYGGLSPAQIEDAVVAAAFAPLARPVP